MKRCPFKTYTDGSECKPCPEECQECFSSDECTFCAREYFLLDNKCNNRCPQGYYENEFTTLCVPCMQDCEFCTSNGCIQCKEGLYLLDEQDVCVETCPDGTYAQDETAGHARCRACDRSCRTCTGPSPADCTSCFGDEPTRDGRCIAPEEPTEEPTEEPGPQQQDGSTGESSESGSNQEAGTVMYIGVAIGVLVLIALAAIAIALLRNRRGSAIIKDQKDRSPFEITNPTYMMNTARPSTYDQGTYSWLIS